MIESSRHRIIGIIGRENGGKAARGSIWDDPMARPPDDPISSVSPCLRGEGALIASVRRIWRTYVPGRPR